MLVCDHNKLLTHDFHYSVSQEGATALQVAEAFDVQRPDIGGGVAISHPFCQIPGHRRIQGVTCVSFYHKQNRSKGMSGCDLWNQVTHWNSKAWFLFSLISRHPRINTVYPCLLASTSSESQARGVHPCQHVVARHTWCLPHQTAHVRCKRLWTVDQLMDLSRLENWHSPQEGAKNWLWRHRQLYK